MVYWWLVGGLVLNNSAMVATLLGLFGVGVLVGNGVGFGWFNWLVVWVVVASGLLGIVGNLGNTGGFVGMCRSMVWFGVVMVTGLTVVGGGGGGFVVTTWVF